MKYDDEGRVMVSAHVTNPDRIVDADGDTYALAAEDYLDFFAAGTRYARVDANGLLVTEYLRRYGDLDTYLRFTADRLRVVVGGVDILDITEAGADTVVWNPAEADVDFRVATTGATNTFFIQGSDGFIGVGIGTPEGRLHSATSNAHNLHYFDCYDDDETKYTRFTLRKSHTDIIGTRVETINTEVLGSIEFRGCDTTPVFDLGALITAKQNGVAGGRVPTDLYFETYGLVAINAGQFYLHHNGGIFSDTLTQQVAAGLVVEYLNNEIYAEASAKKLKVDIRTLEVDTSKLLNLIPKSYTDKKTGREEFGLIAEEVAEIMPEVVVFDEGDRPLGIKLTRLPIVLLNELKKMNKRLLALEA